MAENDNLSNDPVAADNWNRYLYVRDRGHREYCREARRLEEFYLGGGDQWTEADKAILADEGRPALEFNEIMPAVNAAIGYQIANRMDMAFAPRAGMADQETATVLSKVAMQVADNCDLHWRETDVFTDGAIQQRGYFDVRISFNDHIRGEISVAVLDPLDVIPDPDAKSYSPDDWGDVVVTRWLSLDDIEQRWGKKARNKVEAAVEASPPQGEADFGDHGDDEEERNKFGEDSTGASSYNDWTRRDRHMVRVRIIDRQKWVYEMVEVAISIDTGDVRVIEGMDDERKAEIMGQGDVIVTKRMAKRVRWTVTSWDEVLHDDWSPYPFLTVVPFFPYFRRGKTRGMVDNSKGPQEALNKAVSQYIHVISSVANSGWLIEQDSLTNMETDELESAGSKTGIVLEYKKGAAKPEKIQPNRLPEGIDRMIDRLTTTLKDNTVPDAARGIESGERSGIAIQSRQYAAQQQLAIMLDNLARTRKMLATRILWLLQNYYDDERIVRITKQNPVTGQPEDEMLEINAPDPTTGEIRNDLRVGEYDVIVTEQPQQVTFENSQFEQAIEMRREGVNIPDDVLIRNSALAEKGDLLQRMAEQEPESDPEKDAKIELTLAQAAKTRNEAVNKSVEGQYSAVQTAQTIATVPAVAPLADSLLRSAGFQDQDDAPIVPEAEMVEGIEGAEPATNTNPLTPANPAVGMNEGIETPEADG